MNDKSFIASKKAAHLLVGKSKKTPKNESSSFHLLLHHLIDTATVAKQLWRNALGRSTRRKFARAFGLDEDATGDLLVYLCGLHDLGKASPSFQRQLELPSSLLSLVAAGLPIERRIKKYPHGILTCLFVEEHLIDIGWDMHFARLAARALGAHHGLFPQSGDLAAVGKTTTGDEHWTTARSEIAGELAKSCGLQLAGPASQVKPTIAIPLAALATVSDWIASDTSYFPYVSDHMDSSIYAKAAEERARLALISLGWSPRLSQPSPASFVSVFNLKKPRPLQVIVGDLAGEIELPALIVVEAPMGEGKTEAAIYLADVWAAQGKADGLYFALPTQATSNQMFHRVKEYVADRYTETTVNLQLLHGHASLSGEFESLRALGRTPILPSSVSAEQGYDKAPAAVIAAEWFTYRKRSLLAPFGVGTVDQALLAVLQTKHFFLRLWGLAQKTVIIDEVHAYDAYMSRILETLLQWLAGLGCNVILLSATLPAGRREALQEAFYSGLALPKTQNKIPRDDIDSYPRVTWLSPQSSGTKRFGVASFNNRTVKLRKIIGPMDVEGLPVLRKRIGEDLICRLQDGGIVAVICNTVKEAQELYITLKPLFPKTDEYAVLQLFHARFPFGTRRLKEQSVLKRYGKGNSTRRPKRAVLVATQVVEQSLDVDFDFMVSYLAPVDLLLQRMGRMQRHDRIRPSKLTEPCLAIVLPTVVNDELCFDSGSAAVYPSHILLRSWLALRNREEINLPSDLKTLVEEVYSPSDKPPAMTKALRLKWQQTLEELERTHKQQEAFAAALALHPPFADPTFYDEPILALEEENPEIHRKLQALTRLSDPSINVVLLYRKKETTFLDHDCTLPVDLTSAPRPDIAMALLERSVSINHRGIVKELSNRSLRPSGWSRSPLLRHHRILFLDNDHSVVLGKWCLKNDPELGITFDLNSGR